MLGVRKKEKLQSPNVKFCIFKFEETSTAASAALNFSPFPSITILTVNDLPYDPLLGDGPIVAPDANTGCAKTMLINKREVIKEKSIFFNICYLA